MTDLPVPLGPLVGSPPINVADAVERLARLGAVESAIGDVKRDVREWLTAEAQRVKASTGAAANWPCRGLGRALMTDPEAKPRVADADLLARWLEKHAPDVPVVHRGRVEVVDQDAAWAAVVALSHALWEGEGEDLRPSVEALVGALRPFVQVALPEDVLAGLVEDGSAAIVGADGQWGMVELDSKTGELGDAVPGVIVTRANETLTVTVAPEAKRRLSAELARILAPAPALVEPDVAEIVPF